MNEEVSASPGAAGLDRRDFVKRTAIVGGMVWAAPIISSIGSPAFAGTPVGTCSISNIQFLLVNNGPNTFKWEADEFGEGGGDSSTPPCVSALDDIKFAEWCSGTPGTSDQVSVTRIDDTLWRIDPADGYGVAWATVKTGGGQADFEDCYLVEGSRVKGQSLYVTCLGNGFNQAGSKECPAP
jgi:hypothetical protein